MLRLGRETFELTRLYWPAYLVFESDIPEPTLRFEIARDEFHRRFPVWGIRCDDTNELAAFMNAVQLRLNLAHHELPADGWRYAIRAAGVAVEPNCLCLLAATVNPSARRLGFPRILIERAKQAARKLGFSTMIAPVRPTLKNDFPDLDLTDYIAKRNADGEVYDPWIRLHVKSGGEIVNICPDSVRIEATLGKWREWTALPLTTGGSHTIPGGGASRGRRGTERGTLPGSERMGALPD